MQTASGKTIGVNIGNQEHRIGLADVLVTRDNHNRIRIHRHSSRGDRQRGATRLRTSQNSRVGVLLSIVIHNFRSVKDGGGSSTFHQNTISVPSVILAFNIYTISRSSSDSHLSTIANIRFGRNNRNDFRNRINIHINRILGSTLTTRGELLHIKRVMMRTCGRSNRVSKRGGTRNSIHTISIHSIQPTIDKLTSIPIIERSRQSGNTAFTKNCIGSRDIHNRSIIDINQSLADCCTTIVIFQFNGKAVRIISVILMQLNGITICSISSRIHFSVVLKPFISGILHRRIQMSNKSNILTFVIADNRIRDKLESRVRVNNDGIRIIINI